MCRIMGFGEERSSFRNLFSKPTPGFLLLNILPDVYVFPDLYMRTQEMFVLSFLLFIYISRASEISLLSLFSERQSWTNWVRSIFAVLPVPVRYFSFILDDCVHFERAKCSLMNFWSRWRTHLWSSLHYKKEKRLKKGYWGTMKSVCWIL